MTQPFTYMSPAGVSKDEAFFFLFDTSHISYMSICKYHFGFESIFENVVMLNLTQLQGI